MRACSNCGYSNDDNAETCLRCNSWRLGPPAPILLATAEENREKKRQYLRGLGLGLIPLLVFLLATGFSFGASFGSSRLGTAAFLLFISLLAYIVALISTIVCLYNPRDRFVGYGLLTVVLASPIIGGIACVASLNIR